MGGKAGHDREHEQHLIVMQSRITIEDFTQNVTQASVFIFPLSHQGSHFLNLFSFQSLMADFNGGI